MIQLVIKFMRCWCCYLCVCFSPFLCFSQCQVLTNLNEHGNTSAGSIPIALAAAVKSGQVKEGDVIACAGFGAGLSWGAAVIKWG